MGRYIKPIGGEYWFDKNLFDEKSGNINQGYGIFLSGGQSAIRFILEDLKMKSNELILMPSYLCSTILYDFNKLNIKYDFYEINNDFSINIESITNKIEINNVKAVFFIDYFGFYHKEDVLKSLLSLKRKGIILIEDAVQMFWFRKRKEFIGDYIFNSFRKFLPIDGSIVLCNKLREFTCTSDAYYELIKKARVAKTLYINKGFGNEEEYLRLFSKANEEYYKRHKIYGMDNISKYMLNKVDYNRIKEIRIKNYFYLYDKLTKYSGINIIFNKNLIKDNIPLGLPILINNRDLVRSKLMNYSIYCPVHWNLENVKEINKHDNILDLSSKILTLPIDHRYRKTDIDYLVSQLIEEMGVIQ